MGVEKNPEKGIFFRHLFGKQTEIEKCCQKYEDACAVERHG